MSLLSDELRDIVKPFRLARETDVARDIKANLFSMSKCDGGGTTQTLTTQGGDLKYPDSTWSRITRQRFQLVFEFTTGLG